MSLIMILISISMNIKLKNKGGGVKSIKEEKRRYIILCHLFVYFVPRRNFKVLCFVIHTISYFTSGNAQ